MLSKEIWFNNQPSVSWYWKTPWLIWMMKSSALAFLAKSLMSMSLISSSPEISRNCGQNPSNHMGQENMENNWNVYGMFTSIIVRLGQMKPNGMSSWKSRWTKKRDVVELFLVDNVCLRFFYSSIMNIIHVKSCYGILDVKRTCHPSSMIFIDYGWISGWLPAGSDVVE